MAELARNAGDLSARGGYAVEKSVDCVDGLAFCIYACTTSCYTAYANAKQAKAPVSVLVRCICGMAVNNKRIFIGSG